MYESFYGLRERPFDLVPNPRFLYLTERQREALSNLRYGLSTSRGLTLMLGEAGTGKTTLVQAAVSELNPATVKFALLSNPTLTREEFYEYLAHAFGLSAEAAHSKTRLLTELASELELRSASGGLTALLIDEAQSMPYELLEEVRLLSNIETPTAKLLNVVLAGQPELAARMNEPSLRQLKQRISLRCQLTPMTLAETAAYIAGRIRTAGGQPERVFTREAVRAVFEAGGGFPRTTNVICENALIGGFAAQARPVTSTFIREVSQDFDLPAPRVGPEPPPRDDRHADEPAAAVEQPVQGLRRATVPIAVEPGAPREIDSAPMFEAFTKKRKFSFF